MGIYTSKPMPAGYRTRKQRELEAEANKLLKAGKKGGYKFYFGEPHATNKLIAPHLKRKK